MSPPDAEAPQGPTSPRDAITTTPATKPNVTVDSSGAGYGEAFEIYHRVGWSALPLRRGTKFPPPKDSTGHDGIVASYADMYAWAEQFPDGNVAVRVPDGGVGIDVDAYGGKTGAATLAEAEKRWGKLPPTYRSTSRDDGVSGIRLFRVPEGTTLRDGVTFPELKLGGIDIIQEHHRYAVVWPSIHPNGGQYRWIDELDGSVMDQPPAVADLPDLPAAWLEALSEPARNGTTVDPENAYSVQEAITGGQPSQRVGFKLGAALSELYGPACRHDAIRDHVLGLLRCGKQGEPGVKPALQALREAFTNKVGPDRPGGHAQALGEFNRFVTGDRVPKLLADASYDDGGGQEVCADGSAPEPAPAADSGTHVDDVTTWEPLDLGPYLRGEIEPPTATLGIARSDGLRFIYPGREHAVLGETESGKTWFALGCVAGELLAGNHVVYIHYEEGDPGSAIERLRLLDVPDSLIQQRFRFVAPVKPIRAGWIDPLLDPAPSLVVHDGVNEAMALHGADIMGADGASAFRRALVIPCTRTGAATLACDHLAKDREGRGRDAYGSVHKGNAMDGSRIVLENARPFGRGMRGVSYVFVTKDRPGRLRRHGRPTETPGKTFMGTLIVDDSETYGPDFAMLFFAPADVDEEAAAAGPAPTAGLADDVCAVIDALPDHTVASLRMLFAEMRKAGHQVRDDNVRSAIDDLLVTGRLAEVRGSRGARAYQVALLPVALDPPEVPPVDGTESDEEGGEK